MSPKGKVLSALVRARNEEEFLFPSVSSIADIVEEIVIVDNMSTDRTPQIIEALQRAYPDKVFSYRYPFKLARAGNDNAAALAEQGPSSPSLLANHMNWSVKKCSKPYVLKWDGDMIATERFYESVERWRTTGDIIVFFRGVNVHPDLEHLVGAIDQYPSHFESRLTQSTEAIPVDRAVELAKLVSSLTYTAEEPLIFPRLLTTHISTPWSEGISSSFLSKEFTHREQEITFFHLKFCKSNPYANMSDGFTEMVRTNVTLGPELSRESRDQLLAHLSKHRARINR